MSAVKPDFLGKIKGVKHTSQDAELPVSNQLSLVASSALFNSQDQLTASRLLKSLFVKMRITCIAQNVR